MSASLVFSLWEKTKLISLQKNQTLSAGCGEDDVVLVQNVQDKQTPAVAAGIIIRYSKLCKISPFPSRAQQYINRKWLSSIFALFSQSGVSISLANTNWMKSHFRWTLFTGCCRYLLYICAHACLCGSRFVCINHQININYLPQHLVSTLIKSPWQIGRLTLERPQTHTGELTKT